MKETYLNIIMAALLICGALAPMTAVRSADIMPEAPNVAPTILNVQMTPKNPLGSFWDTGTGGDVITVFANVSGAGTDTVVLYHGFCNRDTCPPEQLDVMVHVSGDMYKFTLPGDHLNGWETYEVSSGNLYYVEFRIEAYTFDWAKLSYYPGPDATEYNKFYPAWPPSQLNATSDLSRSTMFVSETFWVNGTSNYWNSTSYPKDFSKLLPADGCPVTVRLDGNVAATGKADANGNYTIQVTAPATPGQYTVNVTVSNATANRNVSCKAPESQITVNPHVLGLTLGLNSTTALPEQQLWANGTVELDSAPEGAGLQVNLTVKGTAISWNTTTEADGSYSSQFNVPADVGDYTVNATVWHPTHNIRAYAEADFSVLATPLPDLVITGADITRMGALIEGVVQRFNVTVRNTGIAAAENARINLTMDGVPVNSTVRTIPAGGSTVIFLNWTATPGAHNLTARADPDNEIEESNDKNNNASMVFTIASRSIGIDLGLSASNVEPGTPMWANGTVTMDGAPAPAGIQVNVSIDGTEDYWLVVTDASGDYSAAFDAYGTEGHYTVNATVKYPGYALEAWATDAFTVAIPPTPDLAVFNSNITIMGNLVNGTQIFFNIVVRNIGTAAASNVQVNVTLNGELLSSTRQNIGTGAQRLINVSWTATEGEHNIRVTVDPADEVAELTKDNNQAWRTFTVAATQAPIDDGPDDDEPEPDVDEGGSLLLPAIVIIIVLVAAIAVLMWMKKGKAPTAVKEEMPEESEPKP